MSVATRIFLILPYGRKEQGIVFPPSLSYFQESASFARYLEGYFPSSQVMGLNVPYRIYVPSDSLGNQLCSETRVMRNHIHWTLKFRFCFCFERVKVKEREGKKKKKKKEKKRKKENKLQAGKTLPTYIFLNRL